MQLSEMFANDEFVVSIEIFPPKTSDGDVALKRHLQTLMAYHPAFVSCTYGAGGSTRDRTVYWCQHIQNELKSTAMAHFTCVGSTREELLSWLEEAKSAGVHNIMALQKDITPFEGGRITKLRSRLNDQFNQLDSKDKDRFEQEMIYYMERLDVSEEQIRLTTHCNYFLELMNDKNSDNGKRLNFVGQEMGREINTLGSKANDADIQRIVILMKDELEKIKEQVLNIV